MRSRVNAQTEALTTRSVLFSCVWWSLWVQKRSKITKIQEKCKKYAKKFAYIKNLLYLCTRFQKQTNQRWRQHHKIGNKIMTTRIKNYTEKNDGREIIIEFVTNDPNAICRIVEGYYVKYWGRKNNQLYIKRFNTEAEALKFANKVLKK